MDMNKLKEIAGIDYKNPTIHGTTDKHIIIGLLEFIAMHKKPTLTQLHDFIKNSAHSSRLSVDALEEKIIQVLLSSLSGIGKHNGIPDSSFNSEQLRLGIQIEKEHTNNLEIAKLIAKDHLISEPKYYNKLAMVEPEEIAKAKREID